MVASKAKGGKFEREICKFLSLWVSGGDREDLFWRSAMSGGRATVAAKNGKQLRAQCGDICAVDPLGNILTDHCYFECKHLKKISFDDLIKDVRGPGRLLSIWLKTVQEAERYSSKHPVLISRQNGCPTLVCSNIDGMRYLMGDFQMPIMIAPAYDLRCVRLCDVLQCRPPQFREVTGRTPARKPAKSKGPKHG